MPLHNAGDMSEINVKTIKHKTWHEMWQKCHNDANNYNKQKKARFFLDCFLFVYVKVLIVERKVQNSVVILGFTGKQAKM